MTDLKKLVLTEAQLRAARADIAAGRTVELSEEELAEWETTGELPASVRARAATLDVCLGCGGKRDYAIDGVVQSLCFDCAHKLPRGQSEKKLTWLGFVYEDDKGEIWVAPPNEPTSLIPLRNAVSERCPQHGKPVHRCKDQYHAPGRPPVK